MLLLQNGGHNSRPLRFRLNYKKCIQGIQLLAAHKPGITQYYVGKVFFFADKEHLLDWGRSISGDSYVAMQHGPVPSTVYDLLKGSSGEPVEVVDDLLTKVRIVTTGNRIHVYSKECNPVCSALSRTDKEYLLSALQIYGKMGFEELRTLSHRDPAYEAAWSKPGSNNEMDISLWLSGCPGLLEELLETAPLSR